MFSIAIVLFYEYNDIYSRSEYKYFTLGVNFIRNIIIYLCKKKKKIKMFKLFIDVNVTLFYLEYLTLEGFQK